MHNHKENHCAVFWKPCLVWWWYLAGGLLTTSGWLRPQLVAERAWRAAQISSICARLSHHPPTHLIHAHALQMHATLFMTISNCRHNMFYLFFACCIRNENCILFAHHKNHQWIFSCRGAVYFRKPEFWILSKLVSEGNSGYCPWQRYINTDWSPVNANTGTNFYQSYFHQKLKRILKVRLVICPLPRAQTGTLWHFLF